MAYTGKEYEEIGAIFANLYTAFADNNTTEAQKIVNQLLTYKKSNPDLVALLMYVVGGFFFTLPNPAAYLIGAGLIAGGRTRSVYKSSQFTALKKKLEST